MRSAAPPTPDSSLVLPPPPKPLCAASAAAAPATLSRLGCGTNHTAALLVAVGENIDRFSSEASFAHLCGAAPVPASPGRTSRHRLNFANNSDANRALHMIVIVRLRYCERTRSYMNRRGRRGQNQKGKSSAASNASSPGELYRTLRADLATLTTPHLTSIGASQGGSGCLRNAEPVCWDVAFRR